LETMVENAEYATVIFESDGAIVAHALYHEQP
jgi:hypothetical protein